MARKTSSKRISSAPKQTTPSETVAKPGTTLSVETAASEAMSDSANALPKPTKKTTVDELRSGLGDLGLDTKGKKDTLFRRLYNYFTRPKPVSTVETGDRTELNTPLSSHADTQAGPSTITTLERKKWGKQPIRSFLCFDVEATCRGGREFDWPNEIIEFPVVLMRWREGSDDEYMPDLESSDDTGTLPISLGNPPRANRLVQVDTFHSYVRPTWQPILSEFCINLTGITQEMVDKSPTFPEMLVELEAWLDKWDLKDARGQLKDAVWVTDGPWDLRDFIPKQLHISPPLPPSPAFPPYFLSRYLNIKAATQTYISEAWKREQYALAHPGQAPNARAMSRITTGWVVYQKDREGPRYNTTITGMIDKLGLGEFEGRQHSGLADATNVARILTYLADQDVLIEPNGKLPPARNSKTWPWMGAPGQVNFEEWMSKQVFDKPDKAKDAVKDEKIVKSDGKTAETALAQGVEAMSITEGATGEVEPIKVDQAPILLAPAIDTSTAGQAK